MLAEILGMTVAQIRHEMSSREFMEWSVYLGRRAQKQQLAQMTAKSGR